MPAPIVPNRGRRPVTQEGKHLQQQVRGVAQAVTNDRRAAQALKVPLGRVDLYPSEVDAPAGFRRCDGAAVSRQTIPELLQAAPAVFGPGDGATTVDLPDLTAWVPAGFTAWIYAGR
jgi:hypothetical protein